RIAIEHHHVERTDIDAQLERRGADDAVDAAGAHRALDLSPLGRQVAAAVAPDPGWLARIVVEHVLEVLGQDLDHQPALGEHQRLEPGLDGNARDAVRLRTGRCPQTQVRIHHRGVPEQYVALPGRGAR